MKNKLEYVKYATYRRVVLQLQQARKELATVIQQRNQLALLASSEPQFFNPLEAMAAEKLRDEILKSMGR